MECPSFQPCARPSGTQDIDLQLLLDARAYLQDRLARRTPRRPWLEAWERFYQTFTPLISRFALACRVPAVDLNDCVQEVWAALVRILPDFDYDRGRGQFRSWLYTVVHGKAVDLLRRRARHKVACLTPQMAAALCGRYGDPATECERHAAREEVRRLLGELRRRVSARSFRVVQLRWIEGRTVQEIAAALELTPQQVRFRHHRMLQKLRVLVGLCSGKYFPRKR
jgi:RNA polymerase sigma factor (sigma-70 family)